MEKISPLKTNAGKVIHGKKNLFPLITFPAFVFKQEILSILKSIKYSMGSDRVRSPAVTFDPRVTAVHQHKISKIEEEKYAREDEEITRKKKKKLFPIYSF